jgi:hypothetical protein
MADLQSEDMHIMPRRDFDWRVKKEISDCLFEEKMRDYFFNRQ